MKNFINRLSFQLFKIFSRLGIYLLPAHYYIPIADVNQLERTKPIWATKSSLPGLQSNLDEQAENLKRICLPYQKEYEKNLTYRNAVNDHFGPGYGYIEAQALHGFIRHYRPKRIIEIGSGVSTYCMLDTLEKNEKENNTSFLLTCVEPYPSKPLKKLENIRLIEKQIQTIPLNEFDELETGDFLFIDSTHTVKPGGDVNYLILEILPRLKQGVFVHFHDIFLPYDYPRNVLTSYFQWMETSLLRAFLTHNHKARIIFCLSQLHYDRQNVMNEVFPEYIPAPDKNGIETKSDKGSASVHGHFPASIFFEIL